MAGPNKMNEELPEWTLSKNKLLESQIACGRHPFFVISSEGQQQSL
jgi:hypothetical protein